MLLGRYELMVEKICYELATEGGCVQWDSILIVRGTSSARKLNRRIESRARWEEDN